MTALRSTVRRNVVVATVLALAAASVASVGAEAKPGGKCDVTNTDLHTRYATLQAAVDAARRGDTLRVKGTCVGTTVIVRSVTIDGQPSATLDGDHAGSVITISNAATVTLSDVSITHGAALNGLHSGGGILLSGGATSLRLIRSTVTENTASGQGGGIHVFDTSGTLTLESSVVSGNAASSGGGIASNHGGPIFLNDTSSVHHNTATIGGGIEVGEATGVTLNDQSSVHDNTASSYGGGIFIALADVELNDASSVYNNSADRGGGVFSGGAGVRLTINDQGLIHDNTATTGGGGIWNRPGATLTNCTAGVSVLDNVPDDIVIAP